MHMTSSRKKFFSSIVVFAGAVICFPGPAQAGVSDQGSREAQISDRKPYVVAHRGGRKWAPENTMAAFKKAIDAGVYGIELDIHRSKSGELMVIHDETVNRTTNGTGLIKDMTFAELQKLDAGSWFAPSFKDERVPLLSEVLALINGKCVLNVEIKNIPVAYPGIEDDLLKRFPLTNIPTRSSSAPSTMSFCIAFTRKPLN